MKRLKRTETGGEERERAGEGTSEMHVKKKYPWLRYSPSEDASHCCVRVLFNIQKGSNAVFQREGLRDWENAVGEKRGIISNHGNTPGHMAASEMAEHFLGVSKGQRKSIHAVISQAYSDKVQANRVILS